MVHVYVLLDDMAIPFNSKQSMARSIHQLENLKLELGHAMKQKIKDLEGVHFVSTSEELEQARKLHQDIVILKTGAASKKKKGGKTLT